MVNRVYTEKQVLEGTRTLEIRLRNSPCTLHVTTIHEGSPKFNFNPGRMRRDAYQRAPVTMGACLSVLTITIMSTPSRPTALRRTDKFFATANNDPTVFYLHESIRSKGARKTLLETIVVHRIPIPSEHLTYLSMQKHGGFVTQERNDAKLKIILIDEDHPSGNREFIMRTYAMYDPPRLDIEVEMVNFVSRCVSKGRLVSYMRPPDKGLPGRPPMDSSGNSRLA